MSEYLNDNNFIHAVSTLGKNDVNHLSRDDLFKVLYHFYKNQMCTEKALVESFDEIDLLQKKEHHIEELETTSYKLKEIQENMKAIKERIFQMSTEKKQELSPSLYKKASGLNKDLDSILYYVLDLQHTVKNAS